MPGIRHFDLNDHDEIITWRPMGARTNRMANTVQPDPDLRDYKGIDERIRGRWSPGDDGVWCHREENWRQPWSMPVVG